MFRIFKKIKSILAAIGKKVLAVIHSITATPVYQKVAMFLVGLFSCANIWATSTGAGGFTKATTEISSYQTPVANLMKAIAAVVLQVRLVVHDHGDGAPYGVTSPLKKNNYGNQLRWLSRIQGTTETT